MGKKLIELVAFLLNFFLAILLLLACLVPYISAETLPILSIFSLFVPLLVFANLIFVLFWGFQLNKKVIWSVISLLVTYFSMGSFYHFESNSLVASENGISVLTYNTRLFNKYEWSSDPTISEKIISFVHDSGAAVVAFQEFDVTYASAFSHYPFRYVSATDNSKQAVQAIFSKFPIKEKGVIPFPSSTNTAIYADIQLEGEIVRFYNVHLQSLRFSPDKISTLNEEKRERLLKRLKVSFSKQQQQASLVSAHKAQSPYRSIICGDFNTNQFSSVYHEIKGDFKDSFNEAGSGFGKTFDFTYFPMRIDYILVAPSIEIVTHKNFKLALSDHEPVLSKLRL